MKKTTMLFNKEVEKAKNRSKTPREIQKKLGFSLAVAFQKKVKEFNVPLTQAFVAGWPIDVQVSITPPEEYIKAVELQVAREAETKYLEGLTTDQRLKLAAKMAEAGYGSMEEGADPLEWLMDRLSGSEITNQVESERLDAQIRDKRATFDPAEVEVERVDSDYESFQPVKAHEPDIECPEGSRAEFMENIDGAEGYWDCVKQD